MKKDNREIERFFEENKENIKNPIIKSFLSERENLSLVKKAISEPSNINRANVDESFQNHYLGIAKTKYISNLIHFLSLDFDKKIRRKQERDLLILDKDISSGSSSTPKELIKDENLNMNTPTEESLLDSIENESLIRALKMLSERQIYVLELIYLYELTLREIAVLLQTTPQNISNHHRKALRKLNQLLKEEC